MSRRGFAYRRWLAVVLVALWTGTALWHGAWKPLPEGLSRAGPWREVPTAEFLADRVWVDREGRRRLDREIFDRTLALISGAERLIVADQFLFNEFAGRPDGDDLLPLADTLTAALVDRRRALPELQAIFLTDPINTLYGGIESPQLEALRAAGVEVVVTDLDPLRDSNPLWSATWRLCCRWLGTPAGGGWLPNPVGDAPVPLRTWLRLGNFKANHRKTLSVDRGTGWATLVTSANPHDASSAHGNAGLVVTGPVARDVIDTERAVAAFSRRELSWPAIAPGASAPSEPASGLRARVLTEAAIRDAVVEALEAAGPGSRVDLAMFYLSHRGVIRALLRAHDRGARLRLLLDPNEHAFGRRKNGIPNRPVAAELHRSGVAVRWCHTTGEQCHSKQLLVRRPEGEAILITGSANFTRRNLDDFNPETSLELRGPSEAAALAAAADWFEQRWSNRDGRSFSLDYPRYADSGWLRYLQYRVMEATGLSTF